MFLLKLVVGVHKANNTSTDGGAESLVSEKLHAPCHKMNSTKNVTGQCQHCGGTIFFPAENTGKIARCTLCSRETELVLAVPDTGSPLPKKTIIFTVVAIVILIGGLIALQIAVKRAKKLVSQSDGNVPANAQLNSAPTAGSFATTGFGASSVAVEKAGGSSLVYAVGTITNLTDRRCFGVKVELDLLDRSGQRIATTKDYQSTLEPRATWRFKALVMDRSVDAAKITAIKEDQ
jgi:hypothetical protein